MEMRREIFGLTLPIVLEQIFITLLGVVNTIMVSRVGEEAVSAVGMVDSFNYIFIAFFTALAVGGTVVIAHYTGKGSNRDVNETAKQVIVSGAGLSLVVTIVIYYARKWLLVLLFGAAEAAVLDNAEVYFQISLVTYPLIALALIINGILRGTGDTRTPMKVNIIMNILNVIASYFLIYGFKLHTGPFNMHLDGFGVKGAALGIALARSTGTALLLMVILKGTDRVKVNGLLKFKFDVQKQKSIFGIGIPASTESLMFQGGKLITQIFIVSMGTASIASNSIGGSIFGFINVPGLAFSTAATTLIGMYMGRGETEKAEKAMMYMTMISSVSLMIPCALSFPFAKVLVSFYTDNPEVIKLATTLVRVQAFMVPVFWSIAFVLPAGLKGAGDARYTMVTSMIGMWAFRVVLGYVFGIPLGLGVLGVWLGMYVDWMVRGTLYFIRLRRGKWKTNVVIRDSVQASKA